MRILLIEDDPMIGESMEEALRGECYAVDWVRDGVAAELPIRHDIYDLLLLDLGLSKRQGMDVLRRHRAQGGRHTNSVVTLDGAPLPLSAREFTLLRALLDNPGGVVSKVRLEDKVYGWGQEIQSNAIDVYIHHLRKKLGADFIKNVRGVGYKLASIA